MRSWGLRDSPPHPHDSGGKWPLCPASVWKGGPQVAVSFSCCFGLLRPCREWMTFIRPLGLAVCLEGGFPAGLPESPSASGGAVGIGGGEVAPALLSRWLPSLECHSACLGECVGGWHPAVCILISLELQETALGLQVSLGRSSACLCSLQSYETCRLFFQAPEPGVCALC